MTRGAARTLFTIGHSTRSAPELIAILKAFAITHLLDVRSIPGSAAHPQFGRDALASELREAGVGYTHLAALGGRRPKSRVIAEGVNSGWRVQAFHNYADYAQSEPFQAGLRELLELAARESCVVMCAEVLWWRCHRRIVTDYVLARGVPVTHLFSKTKSEVASLTPFAVTSSRLRICYPAVPAAGASEGGRKARVARGKPRS